MKRILFALCCASCVLSLQVNVAHAQREILPIPNSKAAKDFNRRADRLARLWFARRQRRVTPELLQMLQNEPTSQLREHIVMALGRIEDPQAAKPLRVLLPLAQAQQPGKVTGPAKSVQRDNIPPFRIQLALGRIEARNLHGQSKLNAIARKVGTDWSGIKRMTSRLQVQLRKPGGASKIRNSREKQILDEFYDVLYRMGKREEDIGKLGAYNLLLWPEQKAILSASSSSNEQELNFWLKRALPPSAVGFYPSHLLDLGETVPDALLRQLKIALSTVRRDKQSVAGRKIVGLKAMFDAAAATGDKRFEPVLLEFQKIGDSWTRSFAQDALKVLRSGTPKASIAVP